MSREADAAGAWRAGRRIARFIPRRYVVGGCLWAALHTMPVLVGLVLKEVFDAIAAGRPATATDWVLAFVGVEIARIAVFWSAGVVWQAWWHGVMLMLRANVLGSLLLDREPAAGRLPGSSGEALNRFRDDVEDLTWFVDVWVDVTGGVVFTVAAIAVMVSIDPLVTLVVVLPMIAVVAGTRALSNRLRASYAATRQSGASVSSFVGELMGGVLALKVAGAEQAAMRRLREVNAERRDQAVRSQLLTNLLEVVSYGAVDASVGLVLLLSAPAMRRGDFTVGDLALFTSYAVPLTGLPRWTGRMLARHRQAIVALDRLGRLMPERSAERVVQPSSFRLHGPPPVVPEPDRSLPPLTALTVDRLTARHASGRGVEGASLSLPRGAFTVVTGAVGSGKTTLVRAILGLMPVEAGSVRWNSTAVGNPPLDLVPPAVSYTAQSPRLFSASLEENVRLGHASDGDDLGEALRLAVLEEDIAEMPDGLETLVGPRGVRLSGGQLQRAAVARALVRRPDLLVLDDVSSALDIETERRLWGRVAEAAETCLVVSHRRAALERADHVIVLDGGRVVGSGPLRELLASCTEMQRLWREELLVEGEEEIGA